MKVHHSSIAALLKRLGFSYKKKSLVASEQHRVRVKEARRDWLERRIPFMRRKPERLVFIDETSVKTVSAIWAPPSSELPFLRIRSCLGTGMEFLRGGYIGVFPVGWSG